jgi:hypothetical protein
LAYCAALCAATHAATRRASGLAGVEPFGARAAALMGRRVANWRALVFGFFVDFFLDFFVDFFVPKFPIDSI